MNPHRSNRHFLRLSPFASLALLLLPTFPLARAQDVRIGVTYVCNGEKMFAESCNMRDTSDTSTCMIGHPDHVNPNGLMQYTYATRGALKKLFPTCTQPSAKQVAAADAFQQRQQAAYDANVQKANQQLEAPAQPVTYGQPQKPKTPEEREANRCVTSGRLPSSCLGNSLLGAFGQMLSSVLPSEGKAGPSAGPVMAGVFQGAGNWRLDFIDGGVLVNCSFLSPNQESYSLNLSGGRATLTIATTPRPLVLAFRPDGTITGPAGPVTIDGVVPGGSTGGGSTPGHTETGSYTTTERINANQAGGYDQSQLTGTGGGTYDASTTHTTSTYVPGSYTPAQTTFAPRRTTCPAINLSSKGAGAGVQTMETDLLKSMMGGDKGAPTPPGIRMHGIFAASTGFSLEFFPESVILGCGPDAARAYPYTVVAEGTGAVVKVDVPDHPLTLAFKADGSLDPGSAGPYQVHGRTVTGEDDNDTYSFAPLEQTCNLAVMTPNTTIPSSGGTAGTMVASNANLSMPGSTQGNATLTIISGFPAGAGNPLSTRAYTLLRESVVAIVEKAGVAVPAGVSPYKVLGQACQSGSPNCQAAVNGLKASAASAVRSDAAGSGTFPAVAPGTYYLMITAAYNGHTLTWGQAVQLNPGPNTVKLDASNATPLN